jgi:hypothetical protein
MWDLGGNGKQSAIGEDDGDGDRGGDEGRDGGSGEAGEEEVVWRVLEERERTIEAGDGEERREHAGQEGAGGGEERVEKRRRVHGELAEQHGEGGGEERERGRRGGEKE